MGNMKFKLIKENVEERPGDNGNAYSSSKYLYHQIKVDENKIIAKCESLNEAVDWEVPEELLGGIIVLSTDVNAVELDTNRFINWIKQKYTTIKNRLLFNKKIDKIAQSHDLVGWTVGRFLNGRYTSKRGAVFSENSLSVEIVGVTVEQLIGVAEELCSNFNQETVLVKSYSNKHIYFVNAE